MDGVLSFFETKENERISKMPFFRLVSLVLNGPDFFWAKLMCEVIGLL